MANGKHFLWENVGEAVDPNWRIFGRSAADDKGPIYWLFTCDGFTQKRRQETCFQPKK